MLENESLSRLYSTQKLRRPNLPPAGGGPAATLERQERLIQQNDSG